MSEENVEIVRSGYEHLSRTGELPWELIDEEIAVHDPPIGPDSRVWRGHEGLRAAFANVEESFDDYSFEAEEFHDAGNEVVVFVRLHGRGVGCRQDAPRGRPLQARHSRVHMSAPHFPH